jgi:hypothetical protein
MSSYKPQNIPCGVFDSFIHNPSQKHLKKRMECTETTAKVWGFALTNVWVMEYWRVMGFLALFSGN